MCARGINGAVKGRRGKGNWGGLGKRHLFVLFISAVRSSCKFRWTNPQCFPSLFHPFSFLLTTGMQALKNVFEKKSAFLSCFKKICFNHKHGF